MQKKGGKKRYSHDAPLRSYHQRMTRSEQKAGHKQANEWYERFAEALKMDEENVGKNGETETRYIYLHQMCLCESLSDCGRLFSS